MHRFLAFCCLLGLSVHTGLAGAAAEPPPPKVAPAPPRQEGDGPYSQLILRNATVINGTGAPAFGPAQLGVSLAMSEPLQSGVSPQMCRRLK